MNKIAPLDDETLFHKALSINGEEYKFKPAPYVNNGPKEQLPFLNLLFELQEKSEISYPLKNYLERISLVDSFTGINITTAQSLLEKPKSDRKHWNSNYGSHGWHRYVGRFPPHLIRAIINHFNIQPNEIILDPFVGSGTTLVESRLLGIKAIGVDICPLSTLISRVKSQFPLSNEFLLEIIKKLNLFYNTKWEKFLGNRQIEDISYEEIINRDGNSIKKFKNYQNWFTVEALLGSSILLEFILQLIGYERDIVACALSAKMRSIGNVDVDVVRAEYRRKPRLNVNVLQLVSRLLEKMARDINHSLSSHTNLIGSPDDITIYESNILDIKLAPNSIDYIITSPPYGIESISYLRTHLLSYRVLEPILKHNPYEKNHKVIGSEYLLDQIDSTNDYDLSSRSETFKNFFKHKVKTNSKKDIIRKTMMMKFFSDINSLAAKLNDWLRPNGKIAYIIGNKKIGEFVIPTDKITEEIFSSFGLNKENIIKQKLKTNNSNSQVPWQSRIIKDEFIMFFKKEK